MNFNTLDFLLFFPAITALYWLLPFRFRWALLLAGSYFFYLHWNLQAGCLLLGTTLVSWLAAREIGRAKDRRTRRAWLALALAVALGCLALFNYGRVLAERFGMLAKGQGGTDVWTAPDLLLPVGISFYTFQTLSYVLDVYRGDIQPEGHLGYFALFISFFPQLVAGPIERPENLLPQLKREQHLRSGDLLAGLWLMAVGYFKKVAVADALAPVVDAVYGSPATASGPAVALATLCFALQIYGDFSGYSDIARGAARMMGIRLMENFRRPYAAGTIRDFWRRWHISLTSWFTDYLYKPLGGSRRGLARQCAVTLLVFLTSGLWHGANWTFLLWGGLHGIYQVAGILCRRAGRLPVLPENRWTVLVRRGRTFLLVTFAWIFFRAESVEAAGMLLSRLCSGWTGEGWQSALTQTGLHAAAARIALSLLCLSLLERTGEGYRPGQSLRRDIAFALALFCTVTAIAAAWLAALSANGENAFLYFQF